MPQFANKLDELLADAVLANGIGRQVALNSVRSYLLSTDIRQLRVEVSAVKSLASLRMLQAAGVPVGLQDQFQATFNDRSGKS